MGKTPHTAFRLSDETRSQLARTAEAYKTSMTGALVKMAEQFAALTAAFEARNGHYPFEAWTAGLTAYRQRMGYEPGHMLSKDETDAVDAAIIAANPIIREEQHFDTLRDVIVRLEGFGVDPDVIDHFRSLLP